MAEPSPTRRGEAPRLSIAPMVGRTDRHFWWLMRGITRRTLLYSEMIVAASYTRSVRDGHARAHLVTPEAGRVALQLAGCDPAELAAAARIGEDAGFCEIDLNCGCPSEAAVAGGFGAILATRPRVVAEAVAAMRAAVRVPVTVKLRLGVKGEGEGELEDLVRVCDVVAAAGADRFIVHARTARLSGLSPAANRSVPPLRHDLVLELARERPGLVVELNGGLRDVASARAVIEGTCVRDVMIGRAAWDDPWIFAEADSRVFGTVDPGLSRAAVIDRMIPYAEAWARAGGDPRAPWRGVLGLLRGLPGAKRIRTALATRGDAEPLRTAINARP